MAPLSIGETQLLVRILKPGFITPKLRLLLCVWVAIAASVSVNFWPPVASFEVFVFIISPTVAILVK